MNYQSSYKIQGFSADEKSEIERLKAQVELFWDKELVFYKLFGLKDGMKIVECGCGPGLVGQKLLAAFPNSYVTAFEIDPILVETAQNNARLWKLERYEVSESSILNTGLFNDTYDFAITRLVLEHLSDPVGAVKEVYRILKPGGKAVFIDNDFEFHMRTYPDISELKDLYNAYCVARQDEGGKPKIGRELPGLLKLAGFSNIDLQIVNAHSEIVGDQIFLKSEGSGIPAKLVKDGYLAGEIYSKIAHKWSKLLNTEGHSIFRQMFLCVGKKVLTDEPIFEEKHAEHCFLSEQNIDSQSPQLEEKEYEKNKLSEQKEDYDEPITSAEKKVARIWSEILGREWIGKNENFFEAGGGSIHAPQIVEHLEKEFQTKLSIIDLFDHPTIALLAKHVEPQKVKKEDLSSSQRQEIRFQKILQRREKIRKIKG
jgi:SAM-dependent methyltransferase/acyl carrier protein